MRRNLAMLAVLGGLGAGLGCQHIGGKADCQSHPSDAVIPSPTPPYPAIPVSALPAPAKDKPEAKPETPKAEPPKTVKNEESQEAAPEFKPSGGPN